MIVRCMDGLIGQVRIALMLVLLMLFLAPAGVLAQVPFDVPNAESAKLIVVDTGQVLYEKNSDMPLPPASLTKLMTMLLTVEAIEMGRIAWTDTVRTSAHAAEATGSQIWVAEGDTLTVEQMFRAVTIQSANDASIALAEHIAGSESAFVDMMNLKAQQLGLTDSYFANSHGLPTADGTRATQMSARDAITIARELLLRFPGVLQWSGVWREPLGSGTRNPIVLENTNRLILRYPGADGLKTGHTNEAGYLLVATAERNGVRLMSAVMRTPTAEDRYQATERLFNLGFNGFEAIDVGGPEAAFYVDLASAAEREVAVYTAEPIKVMVPRGLPAQTHTEVQLREGIDAPLVAGDVVGDVVVYIDGNEVMRAPALALQDVQRAGFTTRLWRSTLEWVRSLTSGGE